MSFGTPVALYFTQERVRIMLKTMNRLKNSTGGFQVVELLIVIALISIMLAIGVPAIVGQIGHLRLSRSTRNMATELNAARLKAIAQNTKYRVSFTLPASSYLLTKWDKGTGTWGSELGHPTKNVEAGISIITPGANFITEFFPNGTSTDGAGGLPNSICIDNSSVAGDRMKITISGSTGMINIFTGC